MLSNIKIRTYVVVSLLLFLLIFVVTAAFSVMNFSAVMNELNTLTTQDATARAVLKAVEGRYSSTLMVVVGGTVLILFLTLITYAFFSARLFQPLKRLPSQFDAIASGDLSQRTSSKIQDEVGQIFEALQRMQDSLGRTFSLVRQGVIKISTDAEKIANSNTSLSARIEGQAAALQQTAASMEQLAGTVRQNADNAHQANQLAATASTVAQRGGEAVNEVVNTMQGISASSSKIADIVGVIDSIAFQTNILALNAAVEAARAGEQGRGFAVVASEVRALAQRSAQAAREITALIEDSVAKVSEGSGQVERAGATMQEIVDSVKRVTDIMGEISAATIEQASGIDQVNRAVSQMDLSTLENAQMVEQNARSAAAMSSQVQNLNHTLTCYLSADTKTLEVGNQPKAQTVKGKKPALDATSTKSANRKPTLGVTSTKSTDRKPTPAGLSQPKSNDFRGTNGDANRSSRKKTSEIPGMNASSGTGKDAKLLRPDLSGKKNTSVEDDWVEF